MTEITEAFRLESPAKINLRLEVLKRREDGYHEIRTIFQKISLHDTLYFFLKRKKEIRIRTDHPSLPTGRRNLVYKAIRIILDQSDYEGGVDVLIEKRIPLGAGLGGGSSNAAATLKALNELLSLNLSKKELMVKGTQIGADVPFFLFKGAAIGSGIGERLRKITLPRLWYLLINPDFEVSTRWSYQNFVLTKTKYHFNLHELLKSSRGISGLLYNDLEGVVSARYPEIALMKEMLLSAGATGALMTGSGPTVFGLFSGEKKATEGYKQLEGKVRRRGWRIIQAHSIP
ncbi:MAG: 4-(cytidine 5'-diphospho)-2-C-methyl-D-erythritol kinase [Deltaproteobacteria bacterium]|nr:4-(cytidine 5'-diphospho)-2-C-methyl-D-erythritol kinase [Deltaproteobacteria bacterium]MBM4323515.1 4-(cytidine 5'-diphospho)-2-C-methyl-D-erythritol kinase [Deltaproteobacteria bacterium]